MSEIDERRGTQRSARERQDSEESRSAWQSIAPDAEPSELPWEDAARDLESEPNDRRIRQRLLAKITGEDQAPPTIGRFAILRTLGAGAMGTVYAAYDDQLDREVALKLLHPGHGNDSDATHRMLREAQALAKLSHPNLVPVFEVGHVEDQVFLAMELVQGRTLQRWSRDQDRPWQEVLQRWLEIGRALVAVHEAGLVHRDVKPANALVGDDGRARLVDFGLARGHDAPLLSRTTEAHPPQWASSGSRLMEVITQSRAAVGTPAYMAPEVRWGSRAGPRADQYSLCVSVYESLFGQRPSLGPDGQPLDTPPGIDVPPALRRLLARGLSFDPKQRYPSMRALTEDMERLLGYRRPRWVLGLSTLAVAAGLGGLATWALVEPAAVIDPPPCAGIEDDLDGVWDQPQRTGLRRAIEATALPYASSLADAIDQRLDGYASKWLDHRRAACEATHVEHVQSPDLLDRRMSCLNDQRRRLAGVIEAGSAVDLTRAPRLPVLVANLEDPGECLSDWLMRSPTPPPPPERREAVDDLRATLDQVKTAAILDGPRPIIPSAEQALAEAEQLDHPPLVAETMLLLGWLLLSTEDPRARPTLERAANMAEALGLPRIKEHALRSLVAVSIHTDHDVDRARRALARDLATLTRLGEPPEGMARALELRSLLVAMEGDYDRARTDLRAAIELWDELGDHTAQLRVYAWYGLGDLLAAAGRPDEALYAFDQASALTVGPSAELPRLQRGRAELTRGQSAVVAGRFDEATEWLQRAHSEGLEAYGPDSVFIARVKMAQSDNALRRGQLDLAAEHASHADSIFQRWLGDDHLMRASSLSAVGTIAFLRGRPEASVDAFAEALRLWLQALPPDALEVAVARSNLGEALVAAGEHVRAEPELRQALTILRERLQPGHPQLAFPAHGLAEIELRRGDLDAALDHGTLALRIREHSGDHPVELARTRWLVARIHRQRGSRDRALRLARRAREDFVSLGEDFATEAADIGRWLGGNEPLVETPR